MRNKNITKNGLLKSYKHRVWGFFQSFNAFNIQSISRKENRHVDRLATVHASYDMTKSLENEKK